MELRTFFALELSAGARRAAAEVLAVLREHPGEDVLRLVYEESLHVTLRFLGATGADSLPRLLGAVGEALRGEGRFRVGLTALMGMPSLHRPQVLALGLEPEAPLAGLAAAVERGAVAAGWEAEERPFRPHVTLARARRGRRPQPVTASVTPARETWDVREVVLFQSQLSPGGARYTPLERISLHP